MKIPTKLKIGGHVFKVIETDDIKHMGETDIYESEISIKKSMEHSQKESTLIHEILCHSLNTVMTERKGMHDVLDSMSEQLYQVLKDNNLLK